MDDIKMDDIKMDHDKERFLMDEISKLALEGNVHELQNLLSGYDKNYLKNLFDLNLPAFIYHEGLVNDGDLLDILDRLDDLNYYIEQLRTSIEHSEYLIKELLIPPGIIDKRQYMIDIIKNLKKNKKALKTQLEIKSDLERRKALRNIYVKHMYENDLSNKLFYLLQNEPPFDEKRQLVSLLLEAHGLNLHRRNSFGIKIARNSKKKNKRMK